MILIILQIIVAALLIGAIVLQMQGSGMSTAFGGGAGEFYRSKRSIEKFLLWATVFLATVFAFLSFSLLFPH